VTVENEKLGICLIVGFIGCFVNQIQVKNWVKRLGGLG
jgi:hypothetical protein